MPQVTLSVLIEGLRAGALISFPTDTVPALAALPDQCDRIYAAKQRPLDKPLILMGATFKTLLPYVSGSPEECLIWQRVADRYWPGPLTLVLPASDQMPPAMNPTRSGTLGIRVPDHPLARYLLARTGPLATTSANRSGSAPITRMAAIEAQFPEILMLSKEAQSSLATNLGMVANGDGDGAASGQPSTVVQWSHGEWVTLRSGVVSLPPDAGQEDATEASHS